MKNSKINLYYYLRQYFLDFNNIKNADQGKFKLSSYRYFLWVLILTLLMCFLKEPIINLLIVTRNYRKQGTEDWVFYAYENKKAYLKQITKPKIVVVGGSSALFGIDAQQIESSTGIPTVNMGVFASLGIDYILDKAKKVLKPGDIIVTSIEYPLYYQTHEQQLEDKGLKNYIISYDHDYFNQLNLVEKLKVIALPFGLNQDDIYTIIHLLTNKSPFDKKIVYKKIMEKSAAGECYTGMTLNRNGDEQCNIGKSPTPEVKQAGKFTAELAKESIDLSGSIKDFCIYAKKNNITIVPVYPGTLYLQDYNSQQYKTYFAKIKNFWLAQGIPFEDSPSNSLIKIQMMFNTVYHPNDKGRTWRTKSIISILKNHLHKNI